MKDHSITGFSVTWFPLPLLYSICDLLDRNKQRTGNTRLNKVIDLHENNFTCFGLFIITLLTLARKQLLSINVKRLRNTDEGDQIKSPEIKTNQYKSKGSNHCV